MNNPEELIVLEDFTSVLEEIGIAYAVGGSIASSIYGVVRFTQDADVTVEPFSGKEDRLYELLMPRYYISKEAMHYALRERGSFNVINIESAFKMDVFVRKDTAFEKQLMSRRKLQKLSDTVEKSFSVVSPEDITLMKLKWYRDSGESSERQWNDVLGVLAVQDKHLDFEYLKNYSAVLKINDLLEKAISEVGRRMDEKDGRE